MVNTCTRTQNYRAASGSTPLNPTNARICCVNGILGLEVVVKVESGEVIRMRMNIFDVIRSFRGTVPGDTASALYETTSRPA